MILTLFCVSIIAFIVIQLPPGDFITTYAKNLEASGVPMNDVVLETLRKQYGLDKSMPEQYVIWITKFVRGDMGQSFDWKRPVNELIFERLALTFGISLFAMLLSWIIAIPVGVYSAVKQYSFSDYLFTLISFLGLAIPPFLLALVTMYISFKHLGIDVGGLFSPEYVNAEWSWGRFVDMLLHLRIPVIILAVSGTAALVRIMRANLLDELKKPYVVTARAKGLPFKRVIIKYPVRVAINPFISTIGYTLPYLISGSTIVAVVLNLPTSGPLLLQSLLSQDMYLAGSFIMLLSVLTVIGTFISDILLTLADPRIRYQ